MAPDTAAERHAFEADSSGISCVYCGLPEPNARHATIARRLRWVEEQITIWEHESATANKVLANLYDARRRLQTAVDSGGTLTSQSAASQGDSTTQS